MKKRSFQLISFFLVISIVLSGCSINDLLSRFGIGDEESSGIEFYGLINCYQEPSYDSEITTTFHDGVIAQVLSTTTIEGVTWAQTQYGWIPMESVDVAVSEEPAVIETGFVTGVQLRVRSAPGAENEKIGELATGTKVQFTEFADVSDGTWGKMEQGWIFMEHVYIPGTVTQRHGYVVAKQSASVYDAILQPRNSVKDLSVGDRVEILHYITFTGDERWGYTNDGWIDLRSFYVEGEEGANPASGIVQDTTPLNVRKGPGTQYDIITTLENGTKVQVKEQITCTYDTWGYNGTGWIAMSRVVKESAVNGVLVGRWFQVYRGTYEGVDIMTGSTLRFYSDGTFENINHESMLRYDANGNLESVPNTGMGSQTYSGTYRYDGNAVYFTTTYIEWEGDVASPSEEKISVRVENGNALYLGDDAHAFLKCEENESLTSIISRFGI